MLFWGIIAGASLLFVMLVIWIIANSCFTVAQQKEYIVEKWGKFKCIAKPGFHWKVPIADRIAGDVNLRVCEVNVPIETKTSDDVFVLLKVAVQYFVSNTYDAFYKLEDPEKQIKSYVFDVIVAKVPDLTLDEVFKKKDEIALAVKTVLSTTMTSFGYGIQQTLVVDIEPASEVKRAMNAIQEATRLRVAANEKGEGEKILMIKAAEAEAASKVLQGQGISGMRAQIINGLKESIHDFQEAVSGATPQDVMQLVLLTQYFDTLRELGANAGAKVLFVPNSPGAVGDFASQMRDSVLSASEAVKS